MRKFYYELDEDESYTVLEEGGGYEQGLFYDVAICWVTDEEDAKGLIDLLHQLQKDSV